MAHSPELGVKVYVALLVLLTVAGLQVPEMPLSEVPGSSGALVPRQNGDKGVNDGTVGAFTVMVSVALFAH